MWLKVWLDNIFFTYHGAQLHILTPPKGFVGPCAKGIEAPIAHFQTAKCAFIFRVCCKVEVQPNDAQLGFTFNNTNFHQVLVDNL